MMPDFINAPVAGRAGHIAGGIRFPQAVRNIHLAQPRVA